MINSKDLMEKKSALDFIIDALQYLISTQGDSRNEQYKALALSVSDNMDGKVYAVVKKELEELMKLSNEYFDVRHNDYLNAAKEKIDFTIEDITYIAKILLGKSKMDLPM